MSGSCYSVAPISGGQATPIDEDEFKKAFIITSSDLGDGHFRYMATVDRRIVNILQAPKQDIDDLTNPLSAEFVTVTNGRDRIAAGLNGKAVKPTVVKLTSHQKIAAGLTAKANK